MLVKGSPDSSPLVQRITNKTMPPKGVGLPLSNAEVELKTKDKEAYAKYQELKSQLRAYDSVKPKDPGYISTIFELGPDSPSTHVLAAGIYDRLLEEVQPGFPALLANGEQPNIVPTASSSGRLCEKYMVAWSSTFAMSEKVTMLWT